LDENLQVFYFIVSFLFFLQSLIPVWSIFFRLVCDHCMRNPVGRGYKQPTTAQSGTGEEIYNNFHKFAQRYVKTIYEEMKNFEGDELLIQYQRELKCYVRAMSVTNGMLAYLNRYWIQKTADNSKEVYRIFVLALLVWRDNVFYPLVDRVTGCILDFIRKDRDGEAIDIPLLKEAINDLVTLGIDKDQKGERSPIEYNRFEEQLIVATELYYSLESTQFLAGNSVIDYMKKVEQRIQEEMKRVEQYFQSNTLEPLMRIIDATLITKHQEIIFGEFESLLQEYRIPDLKTMYGIVSRVPSTIPQLQEKMEAFVAATGSKALSGVNDPRTFVEVVLQTYRKYRFLVEDAFRGDPMFEQSLDRACRRFINHRASSDDSSSVAPELVARYTDQLLRKTGEKLEEAMRESILDEIMIIFKYLEEKDAFMKFYSAHLSNRLINSNSFTDHLEDHMIQNLKSSCGLEHTASLKSMFNDMKLSKALQDEFQHSLKNPLPLDFSALVLVKGIWPLKDSPTDFTLPARLRACKDLFEKFYQNKHSSRNLRWIHHYSKGEVKLTYTERNHILQCSVYQMGVLSQFNQGRVFAKEKIRDGTSLNDLTIDKILRTLVSFRVLNARPKLEKGPISDSTQFCLNPKFSADTVRFNVNVKSGKEKTAANQDALKAIRESRLREIQACIVRIMKAKKRFQHRLLVLEVIDHLRSRFVATVPDIKRCIDILIEKDYLERTNDKGDSYSYIS